MTDTESSTPKTPFYREVDGRVLPGFFSEEAFRSTLAYKPQDDDLFVVTYPKCGTTWVGNIVNCIYKDGRPFASLMEFLNQMPFLEMTGAQAAENMAPPRAFKVHEPFHLTPWSPRAKYIFVARNPKDCCVSFYHHTQNIGGYKFEDGKFDDYFELFIEGKVDFGDYFDTLLSWYEHRNDPNVLFITYEQLKKDNRKYILKIAEFMGEKYKKALKTSEDLLDDVIKHSSFSFMKENLNKFIKELWSLPREVVINHPDIPEGMKAVFRDVKPGDLLKEGSQVQFVRKGIVGDWKNHFSADQNKRLEEKFREKTKGTDLENVWKECM